MTETASDPDAPLPVVQRRCAYCGEEFSYQRSASRPPKYCSRIWPEPPRSCQARAKAQRAATKSVGLDLPLTSYQQAGEQVTHAIVSLREILDSHLAALREVEEAALSRIEHAERDARDAWERTRTAETERDEATRAEATAVRHTEAAEAARREAERLAQQAGQDRDTQVRQAWEQVTAKEGERAAAETRASQQANAAAEATRLRQAEYERAEKLAETNRELAGQLAAARVEASRQADAARTDLKAAHEELNRVHAEQATALAQIREQASSEVTQLRQERDRERATAEALRAELAAERRRAEHLIGDLTSAKATSQAATQRADTAERRYDELVLALRDRGNRPGDAPG